VHAAPDTAANNQNGFVIEVAIADVAHYVRPGSALDREAMTRGNSVYFPDRVVPMLPERISNDLCSLRPHEDRAALAVRMVIGADGRKRSHTFHRIMMRSAAKLSYMQAQTAMGGRADGETRPRRTTAARSRSAGAQDPSQGKWHRRARDHPRATGRASTDRGIHDPRQRRSR
jgi:ribonuclease R